MKIINISRVDYEYKSSVEGPIITSTIFSNMVSTFVLQDILSVCKEVDYRISSVYGIITYKIIIKNIGSYKIDGIYFRDQLPNAVQFISDSFLIDGLSKRCVIPQGGISLSPLLPNQQHILYFQVVVLPLTSQNVIVNGCEVAFNHIHDITKPPIRHVVFSNYVCTFISDSVFKEKELQCNIHIPLSLPFVNGIQYIQTKQVRYEYKIIPSPKENRTGVQQKVNVLFLFYFDVEVMYLYNKCLTRKRVLYKTTDLSMQSSKKQWLSTTTAASLIMEMPVGVSILGLDSRAVQVKIENQFDAIKDVKNIMTNYTVFIQVH